MLSRTIRPAAALLARPAVQQQTMGMATLKEIEQRLKSVRNIEKITKVSWGQRSKVKGQRRRRSMGDDWERMGKE